MYTTYTKFALEGFYMYFTNILLTLNLSLRDVSVRLLVTLTMTDPLDLLF